MKILFLIPYPLQTAPSQRFRFEQYLDTLKERDFKIKILPFYSIQSWKLLYTSKLILFAIIPSMFKRFIQLIYISGQDFIFIHRETLPFGPPFFEWLIAKLFRKKIIYDFDDAIWLKDNPDETGLFSFLKWRSKVKYICRWSFKVSSGNKFLAEYARRYNNNVVINPTTIDTSFHIPKEIKNHKLTIGWTGSHSTLKYLEIITPVIAKLENTYEIKFLVIANKNPELPLKSFHFLKWNKKTEIQDLNKIDIGLMPLYDSDWEKGKCGFKSLQYMALEIPVLLSPVGVNTEIVNHEVHGFYCQSENDWEYYLTKLIEDQNLRRRMGINGRKRVVDHYSVDSNSENFLSLFK